MHLGYTIKSLLKERNSSVAAAAKKIGKSKQTLGQMLNRGNFLTDTLLEVMNAESLSPNEVLGPYIEWGPSLVNEADMPYQESGITPMIDADSSHDWPNHVSDEDFLSRRPTIRLPGARWRGDHVAVQVLGDSMSPAIPSFGWVIGGKIIIEEVEEGQAYIILLKKQVLIGRIKEVRENHFLIQPDNNTYQGKLAHYENILEVYHAKGVFSYPFPNSSV